VACLNVDVCRCFCWPAAAIGYLYIYDLPLGLPLRPASTAYLYGLPLRPAFTACLYGLALRLQPVSMPTACLPHHLHLITAIIVIVIVHFLLKRNIYLSLYM
jgi:hypothetical protein